MNRTSLRIRLMRIEEKVSTDTKSDKKIDFSSFSNDELRELIHCYEEKIPLPIELQKKLDNSHVSCQTP